MLKFIIYLSNKFKSINNLLKPVVFKSNIEFELRIVNIIENITEIDL